MFNKSIAALILFATVTGLATAQKQATKQTLCPVCHMPLSAKKTKDNPVAVRLTKKGKVMYCCAGCKMPASVLVKGKK